jgi:rare lipoprotein A
MYRMTAASPTLPIPCFVKVTNLNNHKSVIVKVNDRGPFHQDRILDLSYAAATKLGMMKHGTAHVQVVAIDTSKRHYTAPPNNYLQVAAFSDSKNARNLVSSLKSMMSNPVTVAANDSTEHSLIYRVLIGPIEQKQLTAIQHLLASNGFGRGFITTS